MHSICLNLRLLWLLRSLDLTQNISRMRWPNIDALAIDVLLNSYSSVNSIQLGQYLQQIIVNVTALMGELESACLIFKLYWPICARDFGNKLGRWCLSAIIVKISNLDTMLFLL
jgi:hypothetical protein